MGLVDGSGSRGRLPDLWVQEPVGGGVAGAVGLDAHQVAVGLRAQRHLDGCDLAAVTGERRQLAVEQVAVDADVDPRMVNGPLGIAGPEGTDPVQPVDTVLGPRRPRRRRDQRDPVAVLGHGQGGPTGHCPVVGMPGDAVGTKPQHDVRPDLLDHRAHVVSAEGVRDLVARAVAVTEYQGRPDRQSSQRIIQLPASGGGQGCRRLADGIVGALLPQGGHHVDHPTSPPGHLGHEAGSQEALVVGVGPHCEKGRPGAAEPGGQGFDGLAAGGRRRSGAGDRCHAPIVRDPALRVLAMRWSFPGGGWRKRPNLVRTQPGGPLGYDPDSEGHADSVASVIYEFANCRLDTATAELRRDDELIAVEPQVFAVLEHLVTNPDRLVTKIELLDEVWGDRFVSEAALTSRIKLARRACGDSGRAQRVIKTVHGRGYRMVAPIVERGGAVTIGAVAVASGPGAVGREPEIGQLIEAATRAARGEQATVFVTGAAGAGKSTVVAEFLEETDDLDPWLVLRGQCLRPRSGPEPYFALLDALGTLAATEPDFARDTLERVAPSWLVQLPTLVDDDMAARLERRLLGGARQRMLREGAEAITALARRRPTAIVVEDLHLADDCTLDVLELISSRRDAVPLLVVGTARPGVDAVDHLLTDLSAAGSAITVALSPLDRDAIGELLRDRHPGQAIEPELIDLVCGRCDGNPLFALEILSEWTAAGLVAVTDGSLTMQADAGALSGITPTGLVPLIERTLDRLDADELAVLEAAATAGVAFDAASVAAGLDQALGDTEEVLARMARRPDHIAATGTAIWGDGTVSTSFTFTHQLYREVIRDRTAVGRRLGLHRRIGLALEAGHRGAVEHVAVALADHFVAARDAARAARYLRRAGVQAISRQAHRHALDLFDAALVECDRLDPGTERDTTELAIRLSRGEARVAVAGWPDAGVAEDYERALHLASQLGATDDEDNARYGLATISELRGDFERTEQLLAPLVAADDRSLAMEAHELVACSTFHQGAFERSELNSSAVLSNWSDEAASERMAKVAEHPATSCNSWLSLSNWFLGRSDESLRRAENAVRLGERHRYALATATQQRAMLHQLRREPEACLEWADRTRGLGPELVSRVRMIQADLFRGWALAIGRPSEDRDLRGIADALDRFRAAGVRLNAPYYVALFADALIDRHRCAEAIDLLVEVESMLENTTRTYFHRSEISRLRSQAVLRLGGADAVGRARTALDESLRFAWEMGSPALALRATCDRFALERDQGDATPWREPLMELVARYNGQEPPPDVIRGRSLLDG